MARMRYGTHKFLEAEADRILNESVSVIKKRSAKSDILTPWKEADRRKREVYVPSGTPDPANRSGIFTRPINTAKPHLNSRDGRVAPGRDISGSLKAFIEEHGSPPAEETEG